MIDSILCDILYVIGFQNSRLYNNIVRVCKSIHNKYRSDNMKEIFITYLEDNGSLYVLLDGEKHSIDDNPAVTTDDVSEWYYRGYLHRDNDLPAAIYTNGRQEWWYKGIQFRKTGKFNIITRYGTKEYRHNNVLHSFNDQPAVIYPNGMMCWYNNGKQHRENNKPAIIHSNGTCDFWLDGIRQPRRYISIHDADPNITDNNIIDSNIDDNWI